MKTATVLYWTTTLLFCLLMLGSAVPDVLFLPVAVKGMHGELGYPLYFIPFIGVAKMLGVLALLLPLNARLKEWAYAGLFFDLIGATFSIIASGRAANAVFMVLPLSLAYLFYRKRQRAIYSAGKQASSAIHQPAAPLAAA